MKKFILLTIGLSIVGYLFACSVIVGFIYNAKMQIDQQLNQQIADIIGEY